MNHINDNFYHNISGDSLGGWVSDLDEFSRWNKLRSGVTMEELLSYNSKLGYNPTQYVFLDISFLSSCIHGF